MQKTKALILCGILASSIPASGVVIAGWDTWDDSPNGAGSDTYNATVVNGATGQAVGTAPALEDGWANWPNATYNNGASSDGTWGTVSGDVFPSTSTASAKDAVGLVNSTSSGQLTFTISNTSGSTMELASFHFDGAEMLSKAAGDWSLSILAGSAITEGFVTSGVLPIARPMPAGGFDIDLTGLADTTFDNGESVIFELAFSGGAGTDSGGQNAMIDNVAVMAVPEPSTVAFIFGLSMLALVLFRRYRNAKD